MGNIGAEGPMGNTGYCRRWRRMGKMGGEFSVDGFGEAPSGRTYVTILGRWFMLGVDGWYKK
jgi:hypothetical protein